MCIFYNYSIWYADTMSQDFNQCNTEYFLWNCNLEVFNNIFVIYYRMWAIFKLFIFTQTKKKGWFCTFTQHDIFEIIWHNWISNGVTEIKWHPYLPIKLKKITNNYGWVKSLFEKKINFCICVETQPKQGKSKL